MAPNAAFKPTGDAPQPGELANQIAQAVFGVLKPNLTASGQKKFWAEVVRAGSAQQVVEVTQAWLATLEFLRTPGALDRLEAGERARRRKTRGTTADKLIARLGI
jgi:hypothetical protein